MGPFTSIIKKFSQIFNIWALLFDVTGTGRVAPFHITFIMAPNIFLSLQKAFSLSLFLLTPLSFRIDKYENILNNQISSELK